MCPDFNQPDFSTLTHDAHARPARRASCRRRRPAGDADRIEPWRHAGDSRGRACAVARRPAGAAGARGHVRQAGSSPAAAGTDRRVAPPRVAAVFSLRGRTTSCELDYAFYEDSLRYDAFNAVVPQPTLIFQGLRDASVDHRTVEAVRQRAAERHPVAARRRPSADREPAADVERHPAVPGARRMKRRAELVLCAVASGSGVRAFSGSIGFRVRVRGRRTRPDERSRTRTRPARRDSEARRRLHRHRRCRSRRMSRACWPARRCATASRRRSRRWRSPSGRLRSANRGGIAPTGSISAIRPIVRWCERRWRPPSARRRRRRAGCCCCATASPASIYYSRVVRRPHRDAVRRLARRRGSAVLPSQRRRRLRGRAGVDGGAARSGSAAGAAGVGFRGDRLRDVRIASRNASGRVARLTLDGLQPGMISGQDLRVVVGRTLGWQHIKSTVFDLRQAGRLVSLQRSWVGTRRRHVRHRRGEARRAGDGGRRDSSRKYFPGLEISGISRLTGRHRPPVAPAPQPGPGVRDRQVMVSLPDDDEGERAAIVRDTARARDDGRPRARRRAASARDAAVSSDHGRLRDARPASPGSPQARWSAAKSTCCRWRPFAIAVSLDRTIRHELVHLMTDAALAQRPAWVREGAAIYLPASRPMPPASRDSVPAFKPEPRRLVP